MRNSSDFSFESCGSRSNPESSLGDIDSILSPSVMKFSDSSADREPAIIEDGFLGVSSNVAVDSSTDSATFDLSREISSDNVFENDGFADFDHESRFPVDEDGEVGQLIMCPSFNSYMNNIVESASRAASQLDSSPRFLGFDDSFEFSLLRSDPSTDDVLVFPLFDQNPAIDARRSPNQDDPATDSSRSPKNSDDPEADSSRNPNSDKTATEPSRSPKQNSHDLSSIRVTLKQLFFPDQERVTSNLSSSSSSSSESGGDLEEVAKGPYCVWKPKTSSSVAIEEDSGSKCRKSKSTGSPCKQWRLSDLLSRSCSDGSKTRSGEEVTPIIGSIVGVGGGRRSVGAETSPKKRKTVGKVNRSAHEVLYVWNRAQREDDKRRSFLPYKRNLVGFFSKVS